MDTTYSPDEAYGNRGLNAAAVIRSEAGSALFLIAVLLFIGQIVAGVMADVSSAAAASSSASQVIDNFITQFNSLLAKYNMTLPENFRTGADAVSSTFTTSYIAAMIPKVITAVALLSVFICGKAGSNKTFGLTILRILAIIRLVIEIIVCVLLIAGTAVILASVPDAKLKTVLIVCGIELVFSLLIIAYQLGFTGSLKAARNALSGHPSGRYSLYSAIILVLGSVLTIIGGLVTLALKTPVLFCLQIILGAVANLLFAICLINARKVQY